MNSGAVLVTLFVTTFCMLADLQCSRGEWPDPGHPPVWPSSFQVQFAETVDLGPMGLVRNNGTWYYNFGNLTARYDHLNGQRDVFCQLQNLSPSDPTADCHLLFTKTGDLWVIYPGAQNCCRLCGAAEGCTVLKPDWLKGSRLIGTTVIEGRLCAGWGKKGAVAPEDTWYVDQQGVPCRYHEIVSMFDHNLTFVPGSYSTAAVDPSVFIVPHYCQEKCPHPFPHAHATKRIT